MTTTTAAQSLKYWHDRTIHTPGWKRLLPLAALTSVVVALGVRYLYNFISRRMTLIHQRQQEAAAARASRAAADPTYKETPINLGWLADAIVDGLNKGAKHDDSTCTCFSGMESRTGSQCEYHGRYY